MSYTNGVGGLQQLLGSMTPTTAEPANHPSRSGATAAPSSAANHADQTSLSSASGLIAQALDGSDTRAAKVAALQRAIVSGTYNVSSADVADKMIQSLLK